MRAGWRTRSRFTATPLLRREKFLQHKNTEASRRSTRSPLTSVSAMFSPNLVHGRIGHRTLAIADAVTDTARRALGVMGTQHSVQVADAGSNPAESILPLVEGE